MSGTRTLTIQGYSFEIPAPYAEGHALTAIEAKVLNQTFAENIRNNVAKRVKEAVDAGQDPASIVAEYASTYEFTTPGTGGTARKLDPVEREARTIAREAIKAQLAEQGRKLKDVDPEKLEAAIDTVASREEVLKEAKKRVAAKAKTVELAAEGLDLG